MHCCILRTKRVARTPRDLAYVARWSALFAGAMPSLREGVPHPQGLCPSCTKGCPSTSTLFLLHEGGHISTGTWLVLHVGLPCSLPSLHDGAALPPVLFFFGRGGSIHKHFAIFPRRCCPSRKYFVYVTQVRCFYLFRKCVTVSRRWRKSVPPGVYKTNAIVIFRGYAILAQ